MESPKIILITGGTGLIGKHLVPLLQHEGYQVRVLTQQKNQADQKTFFYWNWKYAFIDEMALKDVYGLVHLAGKNISSGYWTSKNKREIVDSRIQSLLFLVDMFKAQNQMPEVVVSASGVGYYGVNHPDQPCSEKATAGHTFLAQTSAKLEHTLWSEWPSKTRCIALRTGVVLSNRGGLLPILTRLSHLYLAQIIGSGKQVIPWIHVDDIANLYLFVLRETSCRGPYNAVAGNVSQETLTRTLAIHLKKPIIWPRIPKFLVHLILGEMATLVTEGVVIDNSHLMQTGFLFKYPTIEQAIRVQIP